MHNTISYLPDQEKIKERFSFLTSPILLDNVAITYRYIVYLINLDINPDIPPAIKYSIRKDMIVQTASIVESCTYFVVWKHIEVGKFEEKDVMPYGWKEIRCCSLGLLDHDKEVCGIVRQKKHQKFDHHTTFKTINDICKNQEIFSQAIWKHAEELRQARNKLHLAGLGSVDEVYTKIQVDDCMDMASKVIKRIEKKLGEL